MRLAAPIVSPDECVRGRRRVLAAQATDVPEASGKMTAGGAVTRTVGAGGIVGGGVAVVAGVGVVFAGMEVG